MLRRTIAISAITVGVKVFGLGREMAMAHYFGATPSLDAFVIALLIPTTLVELTLSAMHATFVPTYVAVRNAESESGVKRFTGQVGILITVVLLLFALVLIGLAPLASRLVAPGFDTARTALTTRLIRTLSWLILCNGVASFGYSVLQARERFVWVTASPVIAALATLVSLLCNARRLGIWAAVYGILVGAALQCLLTLMRIMRFVSFRWTPSSWRHPELRRLGVLTGPVLVGSSISHLSIFVDQLMASWLPSGRVAALAYANLISNAPTMLLAGALSMVMLPQLSQAAAQHDLSLLRRQSQMACLWAGWLLIPVTVVLVGWPQGVVAFLFQHGVFDRQATQLVSGALVFYALGMVPIVLAFILTRVCAAIQFTTPLLWVPFLTVVVNATLNALFMRWWGHVGIALSTFMTYLMADLILIHLLRRRSAFGFEPFGIQYVLLLLWLAVGGIAGLWALEYGMRIFGGVLVAATISGWMMLGRHGWVRLRST